MKHKAISLLSIFVVVFYIGCKNNDAEKKAAEAFTKNYNDSIASLGELAKDSINEGIMKYDVKSGMIDYETDFGSMGKSTRKLVFENFGATQLRSTPFSIILDRGGFTYYINPTDSVGTKLYTENGDQFNPDLIDFKGLGMELKNRYNYKELGTEVILNRTCQIVSLYNKEMKIKAKYWLYKFIPLKMEITIINHTSYIVAKQFEENVEVDKKNFEIPKKINLVKVSNK